MIIIKCVHDTVLKAIFSGSFSPRFERGEEKSRTAAMMTMKKKMGKDEKKENLCDRRVLGWWKFMKMEAPPWDEDGESLRFEWKIFFEISLRALFPPRRFSTSHIYTQRTFDFAESKATIHLSLAGTFNYIISRLLIRRDRK